MYTPGVYTPIGSLCHFQPHNYTGVLGWFHPKSQVAPITGSVEKSVLKSIIDGSGSDGDKLQAIRRLLI